MRNLIVLSMITLDGVMQAPGGPEEDTSGGFKYGGWVAPYNDDSLGDSMGLHMADRFDLLLGRTTYEIWAGYWPQHEAIWPGINDVTKYVASHDSSLKLTWENSVLLTGNVAAQVKKLKREKSKRDLFVYGSGNFIQTLLKHDLVDQLWLRTFPLTLGSGKHLFADGTIPATFKLTKSSVSAKGIIVANYQRAGAVKTGSMV